MERSTTIKAQAAGFLSKAVLARVAWSLAALAAVAQVWASIVPIHNLDVVFNRMTGAYIAKSGLPWSDPFSFLAQGRPWIEHKWLFDVLLYALGRDSWLPQVVLRTLLFLSLYGLVLWRCRQLGKGGALGAAVFLLLLPMFPDRLDLRADILALVLCALLCNQNRRMKGGPWLAAGILVIWANVHASFIVGVLYLLGASFDAWRSRQLKLPFIALPLAASCLTPYGPLMYTSLWGHAFAGDSLRSVLVEWGPPSWKSLGDLVLCGFACLYLVLAWRQRRFLGLGRSLALLALCLVFFNGRRFFPYLLVAALPWLAAEAARWSGRLWERSLIAVAVLALLTGSLPSTTLPQLQTLRQTSFLDLHKAADFLAREQVKGKVFNSFDFGQFLAGEGYPALRIYMDGRSDLYSLKEFREYLAAVGDPVAFDELDRRYGFDILFLAANERGSRPLYAALQRNRRFVLVYLNELVGIYLRADRFPTLAARYGLRWLRPFMDAAELSRIPAAELRSEVAFARREGTLSELRATLALVFAEADPAQRLRLLLGILKGHAEHYGANLLLIDELVRHGRRSQALQLTKALRERFGETRDLQLLRAELEASPENTPK